MRYDSLIEYINANIDIIYNNFISVFELDGNEMKTTITNLINSFKFNKYLYKKSYTIDIFSIDNLTNLKNSFIKLGFTIDEIKKVIVKSPIIILYSDNLDDIYYLYKNKKYYGYTTLDDSDYNTFMLNDNLNSNIISNNYLVDKMLDYYKIKNFSKETFDNLESDFKLKNYYFKKK